MAGERHLMFVYDDLANPEVLGTLLDEDVQRQQARLPGFEPCVLYSDGIAPDFIRDILATNRSEAEMRDYATLAIRPVFSASFVEGFAVSVTGEQQELMDYWNIVPAWHQRKDNLRIQIDAEINPGSTHIINAGRLVTARSVFGRATPPHSLNDVKRTVEIAGLVRAEFLAKPTL